MENSLHQRRGSFSDPKHHGSTGSRDGNAWNWRLQRTTFHDEDIIDDEHATSVAAAAFAIHSLEEAESRNLQKIREGSKSSRTQTMRRKEDSIHRRPSYGETSMKRPFGQDLRAKENAFPVRRPSSLSSPKPLSPAVASGSQKQKGFPIQHKNVKTRSESWDKVNIEKIKKRYEMIKFKILSWECVKKIQAKLQMERRKRALKKKREMAMRSYKNKMERVDMIAEGAREKLEERRRKQECDAREKANKIRKNGKVPVKCLCFNS